jgi:hypothetical protein
MHRNRMTRQTAKLLWYAWQQGGARPDALREASELLLSAMRLERTGGTVRFLRVFEEYGARCRAACGAAVC